MVFAEHPIESSLPCGLSDVRNENIKASVVKKIWLFADMAGSKMYSISLPASANFLSATTTLAELRALRPLG
jgi:hypothetical protein